MLIALSTWFAPCGWAEELAQTKPATPLEGLKQQSAAQRWERVKSQNESFDESTAAKPLKTRPGMILPLPDNDIASGRSEQKLAPLLPDSTEEPRWIVPARPVPEPVEETETTVEISAPSVSPQVIRPPTKTTFVPIPKPVSSESSSRHPIVAVANEPTQETVPPAAPPKPAGGPRKLRTIQEISPFYDTSVDKDIREFAEERAGDYNVAFGTQTFHPREFPDTLYAWEPTNFYHYPLYFEDAVLERYGHTYHPLIQPAVSVAKFGGQLVTLPYQMTLDPIDRPVYTLGWYRPGDCAPKLRYQPPLNAKAAAVEVGVWTGLFFLVP